MKSIRTIAHLFIDRVDTKDFMSAFYQQIKKFNIDVAKLESEVVVITDATKDDPVSYLPPLE